MEKPQQKQEKKVQTTVAKKEKMVDDITQNFVNINGAKVSKVYVKEGLLGRGGFAQCFITHSKETGKRMATKIIPKKVIEAPRTKLRLTNQIKIHNALHHENIVEFYTNFEDDQNVYMNLELCQNGSLNDLLLVRYELTTPEIRSFVYGLCQGIKYIHSKNIIHRDMKLANIFLDDKNHIKIGDFGLAAKLEFPEQRKRTICGTPNYIAPEVLFGKGYHFEVDAWAIGVILYTLYFYVPPFETEEAYKTYQKIKNCQYTIPKNHLAPPQAIDLIKKILVIDIEQRLTIDGILNHPFFEELNNIPDGLPKIIERRAPTKKQLTNWPVIPKKASQHEKRRSVFDRDEHISVLFQKKSLKLLDTEDSYKICYCVVFEELSKDIYFFILNNANFGIIDNQSSTVYLQNFEQVKKSRNSNNEEPKIRKHQINDKYKSGKFYQVKSSQFPHKMLLNLKIQQILKLKLKFNAQLNKNISINRFHRNQELMVIKFTEKSVQLNFKQGDGFILSNNKKQIFYSSSFFSQLFQDINIKFFNLTKNKQNQQNQQNKIPLFKNKKTTIEKTSLNWKKLKYAEKVFKEIMVSSCKKKKQIE